MKSDESGRVDRRPGEKTTDDSGSEFVANVGHDLKSYLNPIIGFVSVLMQNEREFSAEQRHQLELVLQSAKQMLNRIDALVTFLRLQAGSTVCKAEWVSPRDLLAEVGSYFETRKDELHVEHDETRIRVRVDRRLVARALGELVANALDASQGKEVLINAEYDSSAKRLTFSVHDRGIGLDEGHRARLREVLGRGHDQSLEGLGLGLALAREAADACGAWLEVAGEKDGGSVFSLLLEPDPADIEGA